MIARHLVSVGQFDLTRYGDRTNYRSTRIPSMLEMSGTETRSELGRRHRRKIAKPYGIRSAGMCLLWSVPFPPKVTGFAIRFTGYRNRPISSGRDRLGCLTHACSRGADECDILREMRFDVAHHRVQGIPGLYRGRHE